MLVRCVIKYLFAGPVSYNTYAHIVMIAVMHAHIQGSAVMHAQFVIRLSALRAGW
jgi:hypothetical protein